MEEQSQALPQLDMIECRIIGSLIEKSKATPEYYPMTLNGLMMACNQKTSRKPVVQFDEQTVMLGLDTLKRKGLAATVTGGGSRVIKYKHNIASLYQLLPQEVAVLCLMMLRGPLTPGEINTHSGRLYEFDDLDEVQGVLEKLMEGPLPFVAQLPRRAGQKETRFCHLFCPPEDQGEAEDAAIPQATAHISALEERVRALEDEVSEMKAALGKLMAELM